MSQIEKLRRRGQNRNFARNIVASIVAASMLLILVIARRSEWCELYSAKTAKTFQNK
jgi:hypothetical protein